MLTGIYVGIVERNNDPEKLGRVKVSVPHVYGSVGSESGAVSVNDLPWALPLGLPAGGSAMSGGMDWLPEPGDQVCVQFLDGEPEKPVWSWMMQTQAQAKNFSLHAYGVRNNEVTQPKRGALTRYGHTVEWNSGSIAMSTFYGHQVFLLDGQRDGQITLRTPQGQFLMLDDAGRSVTLFVTDDFYMNAGSTVSLLCGDVRLETLQGGITADLLGALRVNTSSRVQVGALQDIAVTAEQDITLTTPGNLTLAASDCTLDYLGNTYLGRGSTEPFVLGNQLTAFLTSLFAWLSTHTHVSGSPGSSTSPPQVPPMGVVQPQFPALLSTTIFGK